MYYYQKINTYIIKLNYKVINWREITLEITEDELNELTETDFISIYLNIFINEYNKRDN